MKRFLWSGTLILLFGLQAPAQEFPKYEIFAGYGYVRPPGGQANLKGWHTSVAANMTGWLGAAVELETSFATAVGGGIDAKLTPRVSLRLIQAEHVRTHFGPSPENLFRLASGVLFAF